MKSWKDIYTLPLKKHDHDDNQVYDSKDNFVFEFGEIDGGWGAYSQDVFIRILNGEPIKYKSFNVYHVEGNIVSHETTETLIIIRGWGNLTGIGAYNLPEEDASEIQDTFAEWIVFKLNHPPF